MLETPNSKVISPMSNVVPAPRARLIAFYLPQFHPIPENDEWWGRGFTEWTNVAKAKPLFPGHCQPRVPADLGFYDLRVPETRLAQAEMARKAGIEGFCYWHYWFAGKRLLERPFNEVLRTGEPDFPFCLGWANETWSGVWHGNPKRVLMEQLYPGEADHERHFYAVLPAFLDPRYIRVKGKPLFLLYSPEKLPNPQKVLEQWRTLAIKEGLPGIHFVAHVLWSKADYNPELLGFDAVTVCNPSRIRYHSKFEISLSRTKGGISGGDGGSGGNRLKAAAAAAAWKLKGKYRQSNGGPVHVYEYRDAMHYFMETTSPYRIVYPCAVPNWDNSPRSGKRAVVLQGSTPELFRQHLRQVLERAESLSPSHRIVFVKSWNEWAEGNYLEPDLEFGNAYLDVLREEVFDSAGKDLRAQESAAATDGCC